MKTSFSVLNNFMENESQFLYSFHIFSVYSSRAKSNMVFSIYSETILTNANN
jgi:hypothetical protein